MELVFKRVTFVLEQLHVLVFVAIKDHAHAPRSAEHLRVLYGYIVGDVVGVDQRETFDQVQLLAVKIAGAIEPCLVVEMGRVDDERIALPFTT